MRRTTRARQRWNVREPTRRARPIYDELSADELGVEIGLLEDDWEDSLEDLALAAQVAAS